MQRAGNLTQAREKVEVVPNAEEFTRSETTEKAKANSSMGKGDS